MLIFIAVRLVSAKKYTPYVWSMRAVSCAAHRKGGISWKHRKQAANALLGHASKPLWRCGVALWRMAGWEH